MPFDFSEPTHVQPGVIAPYQPAVYQAEVTHYPKAMGMLTLSAVLLAVMLIWHTAPALRRLRARLETGMLAARAEFRERQRRRKCRFDDPRP